MVIDTIKSSNKTENGSWNNFNSRALDKFIRDYDPEFVDCTDKRKYSYWENCEDTVVIRLKSTPTWEMAMALVDLHADEVDYDYDGNHYVIFRLWWD